MNASVAVNFICTSLFEKRICCIVMPRM